MKIRAYWNWGYSGPEGIKSYRPYVRSCDELCNSVYGFYLPWIANVDFFSTKAKFSTGLWCTSSSNGVDLSVYTYDRGDTMVIADIRSSPAEIAEAFSSDHPRIWTDEEVAALAYFYEFYDEESGEFEELDSSDVWAALR